MLSKRVIVPIIVMQLLMVSIFMLQICNVRGQDRTIKIVDPATRLNNVALGNETEPLPPGGIPFTVEIFLSGTTSNLMSFQVAVEFNNTVVRCASAWVPTDNSSFVFYGKNVVTAFDISNTKTPAAPPHATVGAAILNPADAVTVESGLLCMMNFTAIKMGATTLTFLRVKVDTFLLNNKALDIPFTTEAFSVTVFGAKSPPVASFTFSPQIPKANQTLTFDASDSYDPDGEIKSYIWDLGDNTTTTTSNKTVTHKYVKNGLYGVNLTVIDNEGFNGSIMKYIPVGYPPNATFVYTPLFIQPGDMVVFNATESTDPDNGTIVYTWDFDDGNTTTTTDPTITHSYINRGVYYVNLTVTDNDGLFDITVKEIQVGVPPIALFVFQPSSPKAGETVYFDASSSEIGEAGDIFIVSYVWDFDEGNITMTNASTITHAFITSANWRVKLTVYDSDGLYSSYTDVVPVTYEESPEEADWSWYIITAIIFAIIVSVVVIKKKRAAEEEEILEI